MLRHLLLSLAFIAFAASAMAQEVEPTMPKPLADQKARGAQVYYMGRYDSLDGWAMIRAGQPEFYYATPSGKAVVMGLLFSGSGDLITTEQLNSLPLTKEGGLVDLMASQLPNTKIPATALPAPDAASVPPTDKTTPTPAPGPAPAAPIVTPPANNAGAAAPVSTASVANELVPNTPANQMFLQVQAATSVLYGQADKPLFYAFVDPNCPHCQQFLRNAESYVTAGKIAIQMIPVGFDSDSLSKAAFALGTADGANRFLAYAKGDTSQLMAREGISTEGVRNNVRIMERWAMNATPIIVYRNAGGQVKIIKGSPTDLAAAIKDLTGQ